MGGFGSGRGQNAKDTTNDMRAFDIRRLQREGLLTPGRSFNWQWLSNGQKVADINIRTKAACVILKYRSKSQGGIWQSMDYPIPIEWTPCNLSGKRVWFRCPAIGCGRRVAILYGGQKFACRHCHKLVYQCQRETDDDRAARRADTIRRRLGWEPGILNGEGWKPKGMHWRTFERLKAEHEVFANVSFAGMLARLGLIN